MQIFDIVYNKFKFPKICAYKSYFCETTMKTIIIKIIIIIR